MTNEGDRFGQDRGGFGGGDRRERGGGGGGGFGGGGGARRGLRRRGCEFCADKIDIIDYKDTETLRRYVSDRGKIEPRRKAGTCASCQRKVSQAIKRARFMALLPYTSEHQRRSGVVLGRGGR